MKKNRFVIVFICILLLAGCVPVSNNAEEELNENTDTTAAIIPPAKAVNIPPSFVTGLTKINQLRNEGCKCGDTNMPPVGNLVWNAQLAEAAQRHADDLVAHNIFSHTGSDQSEIKDRVSATGYDWTSIGENIAKGYTELEAVIEGWKGSDGHCKNMMGASYAEVGIAQNGVVWVQVLGSRIVQ